MLADRHTDTPLLHDLILLQANFVYLWAFLLLLLRIISNSGAADALFCCNIGLQNCYHFRWLRSQLPLPPRTHARHFACCSKKRLARSATAHARDMNDGVWIVCY